MEMKIELYNQKGGRRFSGQIRCQAKTAKGTQCKKPCQHISGYCSVHAEKLERWA